MAKKRRAVLWVMPVVLLSVIVVAVLASLGGDDGPNASSTGSSADPVTGSTAAISAPPPGEEPSATMEAFLAAWESRDWAAFEATIGPGAELASAQHAAWFFDLDVTSLEFSQIRTDGDPTLTTGTYVVEVGVGDFGVWRYQATADLVPENGRWVIRWDPSALHPSLGDGDHLDVEARWPERALITDATGRAMVAEEPTVLVGVIPGRVQSRPELATALETHLGVSPATLDATLDAPGVQPDWYLPVARVDRETYVTVRPDLYPVPGVAFRVETNRTHVYGALASELIGTTGEITGELLSLLGPPYEAGATVGRSGLERAFETVLAGQPAFDVVRRAFSGDDEVVHGFPGSPGSVVRSGVELEVQQAAEAVVAGSEFPTSIVAIDIATGEIRAAASSPAGGFNEALSGLYPPGSTFKMVVATAALEAGVERSDTVSCPETVTVSGKEFRNAATLPSSLTLEQAFARSCNTAFIQLGTSLDPAALLDVAERFGFDIDYATGLPSAGGRFDPSGDLVEYAASMIGQGAVLASPLHMASVAATVASG